jgi:hypothetical protein
MADDVQLVSGEHGARWELVDALVRGFVQFLYEPMEGLAVPQRR